VQLWPYARVYVGEIGRMLGLDLPPLPLIHQLGTDPAQELDGLNGG
jgi:hypothetical protein